jgi:DNA polymerase III subunit gamma/tau
MASQALYRRYRSQTFDELIGQEHIVQTLRNALAEGRVAHAYLFTGPRGVGKTTVARLLAKAVNCTAAQELRPCGQCESCVATAEGRAVDVIEMDAASHTSVEDAREIIERVQFRPTTGTYKVYIIDEVHMLSTAAFNALLKTLEEPPGHALFILATTENHKVPATILSRCQRFTFNRHTVGATVAHLRAIAGAEGFTLEAGAPEAIARAATGSMRDALSVLDQLMAYGGEVIALEQVRGLLGAAESQEVTALVEALITDDTGAALRAVAGVAEQGADLRQFARDLVERLRALMLLKAGGDSDLLDVTADELAEIQRQAMACDLGALLAWVKLFSELDYKLRTSPYGQLPLEMAIVEAIAVPASPTTAPARPPATPARPAPRAASAAEPRASSVSTGQANAPTPARTTAPPAAEPRASAAPTSQASMPAAAKPDQATPEVVPVAATPAASDEGRIETAAQKPADAAPEAEQVAEAAPAVAPLEAVAESPEGIASANADVAALEQIEGLWPDIVRDVRVFDKTLQALLNSGVRPVDVKGNEVIVEVATDFLYKQLSKPALRQIVERVISKHTGANYALRCVVEAQRRENPNTLREQIRSSRKDQHVKAAINIFDAEIIAVETDEGD